MIPKEKKEILMEFFKDRYVTEGDFHGGWYNGRKYMYSGIMIRTLSLEKLTKFITSQIGFEK